MTIQLGEDRIGVGDVVAVAREGAPAALAPAAAARLAQGRALLDDWSASDKPVYGLTRGLGSRATETIAAADRAAFSEASLRARATGAGGHFETEVARAALFVRAATLARGGAGVRPVIVETQLAMLARGVTPVVPKVGSVGASDLVLCANLGLPLVGLGRAEFLGGVLDGAEAMARAGIPIVELAEKEGLALASSNAVSVGAGALVAHDVAELVALADAVLALSYEAFGGNPSPFDARVAAARPATGQQAAAANLRAMMAGSMLFEPGIPRRVQDPISFRCATPVHGTVRTALAWATEELEIELNAAADNPLILLEAGEIVSTGNFHTAALAVSFDALRLALAQLGTISSERSARLMDPEVSGLPSRLSTHGVTRTGLGLVSLVARTLSRESRHASSPVSSDDVTPMGVEDEAPFTLLGVRRAAEQVGHLRQVLACELMVAAQALDLRRPVRLPPVAEALHAFVRGHVAYLDDDRSTTEDIEVLSAAVAEGSALAAARSAL